MIKYMIMGVAALLLCSGCGKSHQDAPEEDYSKLFPFGGIEKPESSYDDLVVRPCDPNVALERYRYPGVDITQNIRSYTVTLRCRFTELDGGEGDISSRYVVRYIAEDKTLQEIRTSPHWDGKKMQNRVEYTVSLRAYSGYPMYLSVSGLGPRSSIIEASIEAVSNDGLTVVEPLRTHQAQKNEGIDALQEPFCSFVILP